MASQFVYYRPREVRGNFLVGIVLDLGENETGVVDVARNRDQHCGSCGRQRIQSTRQSVTKRNGRQEIYEIDNLLVGDTITITLQDRQVQPVQRSLHTATMEGFTHEMLPFEHQGYVWEVVPLNEIYLFDLDRAKVPFAVLFDRPTPISLSQSPALPERHSRNTRRDTHSTRTLPMVREQHMVSAPGAQRFPVLSSSEYGAHAHFVIPGMGVFHLYGCTIHIHYSEPDY